MHQVHLQTATEVERQFAACWLRVVASQGTRIDEASPTVDDPSRPASPPT
ncbi:MAG: hypothetical protein V5B44_08935 [Candidatus Accumulibacter necessarius]